MPLDDELARRIDANPALRAHEAWLRSVLRPSVRLSLEGDGHRSGGSRFGGSPDLPVSVDWPRHRFGPYRFLGQFDLVELEPYTSTMPAPWSQLLPREGVLSLFVGDDPTGEIDPRAEMFWGNPTYAVAHYASLGLELHRLTPPREVDFGTSVGVRFAADVELPFDRYQVPTAEHDQLEALESARGEARRSHHLFGYPMHCSLGYDPTPKDMVPLLALESSGAREWQWHDGDCLMLFVTPGAVVPGWNALRSDAG